MTESTTIYTLGGSELVNTADVAFVIDTTGSMGSVIDAAKKQLVETVQALSSAGDVGLRMALVEYRDFPPQECSFAARHYDFTDDPQSMKQTINGLVVQGGGDVFEAVYEGLKVAVQKLSWREHAHKFAVLVGDAPPHGIINWFQQSGTADNNFSRYAGGDHWPSGCPSGLDPQSVTSLLEAAGVVLHSVVLGNALTFDAFTILAQLTGGQCYRSSQGAEVIKEIAKTIGKEFETLQFDRKVWEMLSSGLSRDEAVDALGSSHYALSASVMRLSSRGVLVEK